jgi:hypothetical protein
MKALRPFQVVILGVVLSLVAAGCASTGGLGSKPPEEVVLTRAQDRWKALLKRDWATAYEYVTPAYRALVPLDRYGNQFSGPVQWEGATAKSAKCEEKRCEVVVEIVFRTLLPGHRDRVSSTHIQETWVLEDGQWFKFESL